MYLLNTRHKKCQELSERTVRFYCIFRYTHTHTCFISAKSQFTYRSALLVVVFFFVQKSCLIQLLRDLLSLLQKLCRNTIKSLRILYTKYVTSISLRPFSQQSHYMYSFYFFYCFISLLHLASILF